MRASWLRVVVVVCAALCTPADAKRHHGGKNLDGSVSHTTPAHHGTHSGDGAVLPDETYRVHETATFTPVVCYQEERDSLRRLLAGWLDLRSPSPQRRAHHLRRLYRKCNLDGAGGVEAAELQRCLERAHRAKHAQRNYRPGVSFEHLRSLCVQALVQLVDKDHDNHLDHDEFALLLDQDYRPVERECSLEGKRYKDGTIADQNCNHCVCARGDWVCVAFPSCDLDLAHNRNTTEPAKIRQPVEGSVLTIDQWRSFLSRFKAYRAVERSGLQHHKHAPRSGDKLVEKDNKEKKHKQRKPHKRGHKHKAHLKHQKKSEFASQG